MAWGYQDLSFIKYVLACLCFLSVLLCEDFWEESEKSRTPDPQTGKRVVQIPSSLHLRHLPFYTKSLQPKFSHFSPGVCSILLIVSLPSEAFYPPFFQYCSLFNIQNSQVSLCLKSSKDSPWLPEQSPNTFSQHQRSYTIDSSLILCLYSFTNFHIHYNTYYVTSTEHTTAGKEYVPWWGFWHSVEDRH